MSLEQACLDAFAVYRRWSQGLSPLPEAPSPFNLTIREAEQRMKDQLGDDELSELARAVLFPPVWPAKTFHADEQGRIIEPHWMIEEDKKVCAQWCRDREAAWAALAVKLNVEPVPWLTFKPRSDGGSDNSP